MAVATLAGFGNKLERRVRASGWHGAGRVRDESGRRLPAGRARRRSAADSLGVTAEEASRLQEVAGETDDPGNTQGSTPVDARISQDGRFLYVVLPGAGKVGGWRIEDDGTLTKVGEFEGLTQTVDGDKAPGDFTGLGSPAGIEVI